MTDPKQTKPRKKPPRDVIPVAHETPEDDTPITRKELDEAIAELESRLLELIRQSPVTITDSQDVPPRPKTRIPDRLRHVRAVLDKDLYAALEDYAARYHGENISAALSALVWRGLGKPRLSFESDEE